MVRGKKFLQQIGIIFVVSLFAACAGQESTETGFGISSISPAEDAEDVSVGSSIRVGFSGAIDQTSLNAYTLRVEEVVSQSLVEGKVTWDGSSNTAIFKPYMPLPYWTDFRVIVSDKIRSSSGVHVGQAREWWFTTVTNDHQFSTRPAANATGVSPDSIIRVQFAHGTDMNTVTDSNFNVYASTNPGNSISGTLEADTEDDTYVAIFYPDFSLATNTGYTIEFGDGIMQNGSSAFPTGSANKTISFTTGFSSTNSVVMGTIQDDYSYNIETLSNGYLVIAGETWGYFTDNASGEGDGLIAIYDQSGEEIVVHQFGGMTPEAIYDMTVIGNNIYVTGYVDTYDFNDELAERQTFIKQFTFNQNSETIFESWSQTIASNDSFVEGVAMTNDGNNVYVVGLTHGGIGSNSAVGGNDIMVASYTSTGGQNWVKVFGTASDDFPAGITVSNGTVYVAGDTLGDFAFPASTHVGLAPFLISVSSDGFTSNARNLTTGAISANTERTVVGIESMGNDLYVAGTYRTGSMVEVFLSKYSTDGTESNTYTQSSTISGGDLRATSLNVENNTLYLGATLFHVPGGGQNGGHGGMEMSFHGMSQIYAFNGFSFNQVGSDIMAGMHASVRDVVHTGSSLYITGFVHGGVDNLMSHGMGDVFIKQVQ